MTDGKPFNDIADVSTLDPLSEPYFYRQRVAAVVGVSCNTLVTVSTVTQDESNRTWGRSTLFRPEEFDDVKKGIKKKGRTWGPSSVQSKERPAAAER